MSRSVTGELPIPVEEALEKLNKLAEKYNVEFTGDHSSGFAKGHGFHISYQIEGNWPLGMLAMDIIRIL